MTQQAELYTLIVVCDTRDAEKVEALFDEEALAISLLPSSPEQPPESVRMEILLDGEPDLQIVRQHLPFAQEVAVVPVGNLDWIKKVAQDFEPLPIARWTVFGAAHRDKIRDHALALQIDATSAFGTGEHPTTRGCLEVLDDVLTRAGEEAKKWNLLDMGCGSGILAMAFVKATGGTALGIDMEETSIQIARENARANAVADSIVLEVGEGYAHPQVAKRGPYDLIMANIFADPLCEMAPDLKKQLKPNGFAILSGFLTTQVDRVVQAHEAQGLVVRQKKALGEWFVLELGLPTEAS